MQLTSLCSFGSGPSSPGRLRTRWRGGAPPWLRNRGRSRGPRARRRRSPSRAPSCRRSRRGDGCPLRGGRARQGEEQRHRELALPEVVQDGLSDRRFAARVVEQIVDELEGNAQAAAVFGEALRGEEIAARREVRREAAGRGEAVGCLAPGG